MSFSLLSDDQIEAELGARLRRRRVELGWNQTELAERAGVGRRTVSAVENGSGGSMGTFIAMLRALGALDDLAKVLPDPGISPIALTGTTVRERKYPYKPRGKKQTWQWGDEKTDP